MSDPTDEAFWDLVDDIINVANERSQTLDPGVVTSALIYAATRYSAFYVASNSGSRDDLREDKDGAISDFSREFKRRLADNLKDYTDNYNSYLQAKD